MPFWAPAFISSFGLIPKRSKMGATGLLSSAKLCSRVVSCTKWGQSNIHGLHISPVTTHRSPRATCCGLQTAQTDARPHRAHPGPPAAACRLRKLSPDHTNTQSHLLRPADLPQTTQTPPSACATNTVLESCRPGKSLKDTENRASPPQPTRACEECVIADIARPSRRL
jgi:hypothetical protein